MDNIKQHTGMSEKPVLVVVRLLKEFFVEIFEIGLPEPSEGSEQYHRVASAYEFSHKKIAQRG